MVMDMKLEPLAIAGVALPELLQVPGGLPHMDAKVIEILNRPEADGSMQLRVVCNVYDPVRACYTSWPNVRWGLRFYSVDQAARFREGLNEFVRVWIEEEALTVPSVGALDGAPASVPE